MIRIPASNCSQYATCGSCSASGDPLCAWCPSSGSCVMKVENGVVCNDVIGSSNRCPVLHADDVDLDRMTTVTVSLNPWPFNTKRPHSYFCDFGFRGMSSITEGTLVSGGNTIVCSLPRFNQNDHAQFSVSIRLLAEFTYNGDERVEVAALDEVTFFKCSSLRNCSSCAGSLNGKCNWCFSTQNCSSSVQSCSQWPVLRTENCPALGGIMDSGIAVPSVSYPFGATSLRSPLRLKVKSGSDILRDQSLSPKCLFKYGGGRIWEEVPAQRENDGYILCQIQNLKTPKVNDTDLLEGNSREFNLKISVSVARNLEIDYEGVEDGMFLSFYSCSPSRHAHKTSNTCGHCKALDSKWGCVWCGSPKGCVPAGVCEGSSVGNGAVCTASIGSFQPVTGPIDGGTSLTISTVDLDTEISQLRVTVASVECEIDRQRTKPPDTVVCSTGNARNGDRNRPGTVKLIGPKGVIAESNSQYHYLSVLHDKRVIVEPTYGPQSGGTVVSLEGLHIGTGSTHKVWMGSSKCNEVVRLHDHRLRCITSKSFAPNFETIHLVVDDFNSSQYLNFNEQPKFLYKSDPVAEVVPTSVDHGRLQIAPRGGSLVKVVGTGLNSSSVPTFVLRFGHVLVNSPCQIHQSNLLVCRSPNINKFNFNASRQFSDYGLRFSETLEFWSRDHRNWPLFELTADPEFQKATIDVATGILTISGKNLNGSFNEADYNITIIGQKCSVRDLTSQVIICMVNVKPPADNSTFIPIENMAHSPIEIVLGGQLPPIVVSSPQPVDGNDMVDNFMKMFSQNAMIIGIPIAAVLVLVIIVIVIACVASRSKRNAKKFDKSSQGLHNDHQQQQLSRFQRRIFADQTTVTPQEVRWNGELPFHKYRDYCQNFFFPVNDDYRTLQTPPDVANIGVAELERFYRLLLHENFLVAFVNALENPQQHFKHSDITRNAALLSVVLQPHMVYHTQVIRRLLDDLISKTEQRNPNELKQLLRRAEHVVERMLANWLAMCLYDHVLSGPGHALFRLSRACHLKTTSGKVDPNTGRSLYALSERSLLQDPSEPLEITLNIFDNVRTAIQTEEGRRTVIVLDCDTVAQAKAKILDAIYEGVPFSARLTPSDCEIQFVQSDGKRIDLPDDTTGKRDGTMKKPLLIKSFNIENNTKVIIRRAQTGTYGTNTTSLKSVVSQQSSHGGAASSGSGDTHSLLNGSPAIPSSTRPLVATTSGSQNSSAFYDNGGISVYLGDEQKTPGGTRKHGGILNNNRRRGSERGDKRGSRNSNSSSAIAATAIGESANPPSEYFLSLLLITKVCAFDFWVSDLLIQFFLFFTEKSPRTYRQSLHLAVPVTKSQRFNLSTGYSISL